MIDDEIKRVSKLKKADIQTALQEAGLEITGSETIGTMLIAYRKHLKGTMPVTPDEVLDFGAHKGKTFAEAQTKYPDYCVWVRDLFHKDHSTCCPGMYRFACWLEGMHPGSHQRKAEETPLPRSSRATASGAVPKFRGFNPVKEEALPKAKPKVKPTAAKTMARPVFSVPEPGWMPVDASEHEVPEEDKEF